MNKDPKIFLKHILQSIEAIERYVSGLSEEQFLSDEKTQDSVFRRIEIIGEAVKNLPEEFINEHPNIPWRRIAGQRDILIHEYFGVETKLVWELTKNKIPELKEQIEAILQDL